VLAVRPMESIDRDLDPQTGFGDRGFGEYFLNPKFKTARLLFPGCYEKGGKTTFRMWPQRHPSNPDRLLNGRNSNLDVAGLNGVAITQPVYCVRYFGVTDRCGAKFIKNKSDVSPCSFIAARSTSTLVEGVEFKRLPSVLLYDVATAAFTAGEFSNGGIWNSAWNELINPTSRDKAISAPKRLYFVVVSLYENGPSLNLIREQRTRRKDGQNVVEDIARNGVPLGEAPEDPTIVLALSADAGKKLLRFLCQEKQDLSELNPKDPSSGFVYGDPTGRFKAESQTLKGGMFCTIFNPTKVQIEKDSTYVAGAYASGGPSVIPYEVAVSSTYQGPNGSISASMNAAQVENVFVKQGHLFREPSVESETDHILHEPGIEEQCVLLARAFRAVPKLLRACWMSMPQYLEYDAVKAVLNSRTTAVVDVPAAEPEDEDENPKPKKKTGKPVVTSKSKSRHDDDDDEDSEEEYDDDEVDEDDLDEDSDEEDTDDSDDDLDDEEDGDEDEEDEDDEDSDDDEESDDEDDDSEDDDDEDSDDDEESDDEDDDEDSEDDDDEDSDDEEDESSDFGDDDEVEPEIEDKLTRSMAHAKGMERSKKRVSKPVQPAKVQKPKRESKPTKVSKPSKAAGKGSGKASGKKEEKPSTSGKPGRKKKPGK
jgi:hypothetical protein